MLPVSRIRDLVILGIGPENLLVVACDSSGSIGSKPHDTFPSTPAFVAHCATRVAMLEVLSSGARPELIVDTLSVEMHPTGAEMISEIRRMAASIGLDHDRVTGSTEDNVESLVTGLGVTILGSALRSELRPGTSEPGDVVLCLGLPASAPQDTLVPDDPRMVPIETVARVLAIEGVHDALPVGSHGTGFEIAELARTSQLQFVSGEHNLDLDTSGGPASCVLISTTADALDQVLKVMPAEVPRTILGRLEKNL